MLQIQRKILFTCSVILLAYCLTNNDQAESLISDQTFVLGSTNSPTRKPTKKPNVKPTRVPTRKPTIKSTATRKPSILPTSKPTGISSNKPTSQPSKRPGTKSTRNPTKIPTRVPTTKSTKRPTSTPSQIIGPVSTTLFSDSQSYTMDTSGDTFNVLTTEGYKIEFTQDKYFTGGVGLYVPVGRFNYFEWPVGLHAQALTTGVYGSAKFTLTRVDGALFDLTYIKFTLLANTAATGANFEIMPIVNGEDKYPNPIYLDASGYGRMTFSYGLPSTQQLVQAEKYVITLFCDFGINILTLVS
eukprot:gene5609-11324_t